MCLACLQRAAQRALSGPFAALYDRIMASTEAAGLGDARHALLHDLAGEVLEIGAGTGVNLQHYGPDVTRLTAVEPEAPMARRLAERAEASPLDVTVLEAPAEALPVPDHSADVVVSTLVLCTVRDPDAAVAELRRVLKPAGRLVVIEHVRADDARTLRLQRWIEPLWSTVGGGCHLTRDTATTLDEGGFDTTPLERWRLRKAPSFVRPAIRGILPRGGESSGVSTAPA